MRIRLGELEECRRDPHSWIREKLDAQGGGPRGGYDYLLRLGIYRFHKVGDLSIARSYLEQLIQNRRLTNDSRILGTLDRLEAYVRWCSVSGLVVADCGMRVDYDLGHGISLGGTVHRVDVTSEGYRGVQLGSPPPNWADQLGMRLMQRVLGSVYARPENEVQVGVQALDGSWLSTVCLDATSLDAAEQEARRMARHVHTVLRAREAMEEGRGAGTGGTLTS